MRLVDARCRSDSSGRRRSDGYLGRGELAVTFVQEAGTWKIWKLHYFRYMKCDYKKGWVDDTSMINRLNTPLHPMSDTTTYHNPYSPTNIRVGIPCPPKPYAVYDAEKDKNWELDVNKNW